MVNLIKKLFSYKFIRFLFVGGINTAVGYGFYELFLFLGMHNVLATAVSTVIGTVNSYFWSKFFTFKSKNKSVSETIRFIIVYLVVFFIGMLDSYLLVNVWGINAHLAGLINICLNIIISWVGHNFFSFRSKKSETNTVAVEETTKNDNFN